MQRVRVQQHVYGHRITPFAGPPHHLQRRPGSLPRWTAGCSLPFHRSGKFKGSLESIPSHSMALYFNKIISEGLRNQVKLYLFLATLYQGHNKVTLLSSITCITDRSKPGALVHGVITLFVFFFRFRVRNGAVAFIVVPKQ